MENDTLLYTKIADIVGSIPLQKKQVGGWFMLCRVYEKQESPGNKILVDCVRAGAEAAAKKLKLSRALALSVYFDYSEYCSVLVRDIQELTERLSEHRDVLRTELLESPSMQWDEIEHSDIIRYWKKRAQMLLASTSATFYRKESK